jgi:hypothetical protein
VVEAQSSKFKAQEKLKTQSSNRADFGPAPATRITRMAICVLGFELFLSFEL